MEMALSFNDVTFSPVTHQGKLWIRSTELAKALGYSEERSVSKIYQRNADEFTPDMTQVVEISEGVNLTTPTKSRIFSLRGCHLLSMFARTPIAKSFRKWVLDVLDRIAKEESQPSQAAGPDTPIGPADQNILQTIVKTKAFALAKTSHKGGFPQIWSRFNDHFRLGSYKQLPQSKMAEAVEYLVKLEVREKKELPQSQPLFPSAIKSNIPGPQPGDKYYAYLEKVEKWRVATVAERERLYREGVNLLELERMGREIFHVCADYLSLWLKTEVLTSPTSVFDGLLRHNSAPVILAKFLNTNFEDVRKYLK